MTKVRAHMPNKLTVPFVHYNFVRPHQSLDGKTPAEAAGINLNINDGWGDLIELATKYQVTNNSGRDRVDCHGDLSAWGQIGLSLVLR